MIVALPSFEPQFAPTVLAAAVIAFEAPTKIEFEGEEYITTNRGEVYSVMNTIVTIIKDFMEQHSKVNIYEFNALDRDDEYKHSSKSEVQKNKIRGNARLKLYKRYLPKIFGEEWFFNFDGNNAIVNKG